MIIYPWVHLSAHWTWVSQATLFQPALVEFL